MPLEKLLELSPEIHPSQEAPELGRPNGLVVRGILRLMPPGTDVIQILISPCKYSATWLGLSLVCLPPPNKCWRRCDNTMFVAAITRIILFYDGSHDLLFFFF